MLRHENIAGHTFGQLIDDRFVQAGLDVIFQQFDFQVDFMNGRIRTDLLCQIKDAQRADFLHHRDELLAGNSPVVGAEDRTIERWIKKIWELLVQILL